MSMGSVVFDRQVILDTETTGISPKRKDASDKGHRIIEIGCVELIGRRFGRHFHCYLDPEREIDEGAFRVHGISRNFLADKPKFREVVSEFLAFIQDAQLIIHNAAFDLSFLNHELELLEEGRGVIADYSPDVIDTLLMARERYPGQKNNLDALCKRYHIDNSKRELHGALLDAQILGQVYLAMTGGQTRLFLSDCSSNAENVTQENEQKIIRNHIQYKVIKASAAECTLHEERLNAIQGKEW